MTGNRSEISTAGVQDSTDHGIDLEKARRASRLMLEAVGEDPQRDGLVETWQRRVPATLETLTEGTRDSQKPRMCTFPADTEQLVVKTNIPVYSLCEHHLLPYHGVVHVGYRPDEEVVGLSKLPRYVRWSARRLTMQEELTNDIADGLHTELDAGAVLVEITATHLCEAMRGIETETETTTRAEAGEPTEADLRQFKRSVNNA